MALSAHLRPSQRADPCLRGPPIIYRRGGPALPISPTSQRRFMEQMNEALHEGGYSVNELAGFSPTDFERVGPFLAPLGAASSAWSRAAAAPSETGTPIHMPLGAVDTASNRLTASERSISAPPSMNPSAASHELKEDSVSDRPPSQSDRSELCSEVSVGVAFSLESPTVAPFHNPDVASSPGAGCQSWPPPHRLSPPQKENLRPVLERRGAPDCWCELIITGEQCDVCRH